MQQEIESMKRKRGACPRKQGERPHRSSAGAENFDVDASNCISQIKTTANQL
jgi:hypothetical protein